MKQCRARMMMKRRNLILQAVKTRFNHRARRQSGFICAFDYKKGNLSYRRHICQLTPPQPTATHLSKQLSTRLLYNLRKFREESP
jgi:hypothetical protein